MPRAPRLRHRATSARQVPPAAARERCEPLRRRRRGDRRHYPAARRRRRGCRRREPQPGPARAYTHSTYPRPHESCVGTRTNTGGRITHIVPRTRAPQAHTRLLVVVDGAAYSRVGTSNLGRPVRRRSTTLVRGQGCVPVLAVHGHVHALAHVLHDEGHVVVVTRAARHAVREYVVGLDVAVYDAVGVEVR
jgi:hypothetical protein